MSFERVREKFIAWLKLARLQFYPMALISYTIGAVAANKIEHEFNLSVHLIGYICIFLIELCTVFCNEYFDFPTDSINKNAGIFTGGSGMLFAGRIKSNEIKTAILIILCLIFIFGYLLLQASKDVSGLSIAVILLTGLFLGLGYTIPPLKFSYRGLGEIIVAVTFSPYLILCGYFFQTNNLNSSLPWLMSIPLFFAILPAIILAGIPDHQSDRTVLKKTLSVVIGQKAAATASICFALLAAIAGVSLWYLKIISGTIGITIFIVIPHAIILGLAVYKLIKSDNYNRKINKIMMLALTYILWFGLVPLIYLIWV
ncbi:MAG: prenyltransferase [Omnitrophica bacterium]|nr:prenyltransferase [Candidatus Omnitrophota bacterium]